MVPSTFLLRGGRVIDGTGQPARQHDVGFVRGRIVRSDSPELADAPIIDVAGLVVSPGFIDVHTHSDATMLSTKLHGDPPHLALAAVRQGVSTEIAGNCGYSMFPGASQAGAEEALAQFTATIFGTGIAPCDDFGAYEGQQNDLGRVNNIASLTGHSSLRAAAMGFEQRTATDAETTLMMTLLEGSLSAGAVGWSSGLIYAPGTYADTEELVALGRVSANAGAPYVTHLRDEMQHVEEALEEALHIARQSGTALHVSHHKTAGKYSIGKTETTLLMMDAARSEGLDVTCDVYPYVAGSTQLHAMLPPWIVDGGIGKMLARLSDFSVRDRIRMDITNGLVGWENTVGNGGWDRIDIATSPSHVAAEGQPVATLAKQAGQDPVDYVADLLIAEAGNVTIISRSMDEVDVQRVLAHPGTMIGSDGVPKGGKPHPRWAGTFARILGRYVREFEVLTLEDAVHRMTGLPARRFGLSGRGVLTEGNIADIVVFDPASVGDGATFADPLQPPTGIEHVFVHGHHVIAEQKLTGAAPGVMVRRSG
jgi:dihydroorotase/N-acyl-D-amino-acid deacylase